MDWPLAISKNRERLLAIVMALVASLGLSHGGRLTTLPHYLYARALAILRPAEAAARRLIVMAAFQLTERRFSLREPRAVQPDFSLLPKGDPSPRFHLIEPLKPFTQGSPDYTQFSPADSADAQNRTPVPAAALGLRLLALQRALGSLPTHARRIARWYRQRDLALTQNRPHRLSPMRPGLPPCWRTAKRDPIHEVLHDCHSLARLARDGP